MAGVCLPALALALGTGCVLDRTGMSRTASAEREMIRTQERVSSLEQRVEMDLSSTSTRLSAVARDSELNQKNLANSGALLEVLLAEVQSTRGSLESVERRVRESEARDERLQDNLAFQLQEVERRLTALEQMLGVTATGAPAPSATVATAPGVQPPATGGAVAAAPTAPPDLVPRARTALAEGNPRLAAALLKDFGQRYPDSPDLEEALFLHAEALFRDNQYKSAITAYQAVIERFPSSPRIPQVMLKQGLAFANLGETEDAKVFLGELVRIFPDSPEAKSAQAKLNELKRTK